MTIRRLLAAGAAGLALGAALPAAAQSIDYGSLEQIFNEPVTTSATGSPQRASQAPVDMDIISAADIQRSGAADLPTILSRVAGVDVNTWGAGSADVGVRGYNAAMNPRLLVLVNGRQVYLDFYGYTAWSTLPVRLEEIRQIEVVKGPNAALFGFNAVSGVINIITYNPKYDDKSFATGRVGNEGYKEASIGQTLTLGRRFAARLTGGVSQQHEFKENPDVGPLLKPVQRLSANIDTVTQLADKLELRVEGGWSHDRQNDEASGGGYLNSKYLTTDVKGALNWEAPIGDVQLQAYQNRATMKFNIGDPISSKISVMSAQDLFKVGAKHTFRTSAEYRKTDMSLSGGAQLTYEVKSASAMWNWQVLDNLSFTAAGRYDDLRLWRTGPLPANLPVTNTIFARRITQPSYNVGVVWQATERDTFRATYARGAQIPSLADLGVQVLIAPGLLFNGNPFLEPTIVTNYGLSYDRAIPQIKGAATLRLFYQKSRDIKGLPNLAHPDFLLPMAIATYQNVGESEMRGVEATAKGAYASGVRWSANYTYTDVSDHPRSGADLVIHKVAYALTTPKHRANLNLGWDGGRWTVDSFVRLQSKEVAYARLDGAPVKIGAYATLAGRVAYNFDHGFTLSLSGQNLGTSRQQQTGNLLVERRVFATLSKTW